MEENNQPIVNNIVRKDSLKRILLSTFSVIIILLTLTATLGFFFVYVPANKMLAHVNQAKIETDNLKLAISDKNLDSAKISISKLKSQIQIIESDYKGFSWASKLPFIKNYYNDGNSAIFIAKEGLDTGDIVINVIEPYKDFLGIKGGSVDNAKTTEDRITFLTESIEGLVPHLDTIDTKVNNIATALDQIDPNRYPEEIKGLKIKQTLLTSQETIAEVSRLVKNGKPILAKTSWLLGKDKPRHYLLMFQNNAELRPTGGFWTAYGLLKVDNGKITPLVSEDMYALDAKLKNSIPAPRPIKAYHINVNNLHIRDMNLSPDYPTSVEQFLKYYNQLSSDKEKIDAVIGIDLDVLVNMVRVLGKVGVFGLGNFSADADPRCNGCPQIIYQLEYMADKPKSYIDTNRKGFLSPLMHSLLANAMGSEKSKISPLAQAMLTDIYQKHILFYFVDPELQKAAETINIAGKINETDLNTDYFHLNDSNMASAKSNLFIEQKIKHEITVKNGDIEHKVSVTYTNPNKASNCNLEKGDLCLNASKYRDWFRFYVPQGSQLIKMTGTEVEPVVYEELNKQVFEGFYGNKYPLYAESSLKTTVQYISGVKPSANYSLLLQKQPGTKPIDYEMYVNGNKINSFEWVADKTIKLAL